MTASGTTRKAVSARLFPVTGKWTPARGYSENSKANRIETMKGPAEFRKIRLVESRKIAKEKSENSDAMRTLWASAASDSQFPNSLIQAAPSQPAWADVGFRR